MNVEKIARVCHEVNRVLTEYAEDVPVQPPWEDCDVDMQSSCIRGVEFALQNPEATPEEQHEAWMKDRLAEGWCWGPVKDPIKKTHPALMPYEDLSEATRLKDAVFRCVVRTLAQPIEPPQG